MKKIIAILAVTAMVACKNQTATETTANPNDSTTVQVDSTQTTADSTAKDVKPN